MSTVGHTQMHTKLSTLCYIERDDCYLMLHRTKKAQDINEGKWIGVGGHFEAGESPEECLLREVTEETGYTLTDYRFRGIVTFVYNKHDNTGDGAAVLSEPSVIVEYMHLFTADGYTGEPIPCSEGELQWIPKQDILNLNLWEGDRIFLKLLAEDAPFFSLKLVYDSNDKLVESMLNGTVNE